MMRMHFRRLASHAVATVVIVLCSRSSSASAADESPNPTKAAAAIRVMHDEVSKLRTTLERGQEKIPAELKPEPILRYTDPRRDFPDATLWVWTVQGRPVAVSKLEQSTQAGKALWQYCLSSVSDERITVGWPTGNVWKSQRAGKVFQLLDGEDPPQETATRRLIQMRNIAKRFRATITDHEGQSEEMRLLTQPILRYSSPDKALIDGAIFGVASNGTNPDALLLVQARRQAVDSQPVWEYGWVGITGDAVTVHLEQATIFKHAGANGPGDHGSWVWSVVPIK